MYEDSPSEIASSAKTPDPAPPSAPIRRGSIGVNVVLQIVLGCVLFAMANYLGYRHFWQADKTYDRQFTLSESTLKILDSLDKKISITVIAQKGTTEQRDLWQLVEQYYNQAKGREKLKIQLIDPLKDVDALTKLRDEASAYRIRLDEQGVFLRVMGKVGKTEAEDKEHAANFIAMGALYRYMPDRDGRMVPSAFLGESAITGGIMAISRGDKPNVYVVFGKGEQRVTPVGNALKTLSDITNRQNIALHPFYFADNADVPADADALFFMGLESDLNERELEMLRRYWQGKRKAIFFLLRCESDFTTPILDKFLTENGVMPQQDRVIRTHGTATGTEKEFQVEAEFQEGSPVVASLKGLTTQLPGRTRSLRLLPDAEKPRTENIEIKPLLVAASGFWGETEYHDRSPEAGDKDNKPPIHVAAALERGASKDPVVATGSSRMIVVGNASILDPDVLLPSNHDLVQASLQWMLGRENFIGINPRPKTLFRVTVTSSQQSRIFILTVIVLPLIVALIGLLVWGARRSN